MRGRAREGRLARFCSSAPIWHSVAARSDAPSGIPFDGIVWRERLRTGHFSRADHQAPDGFAFVEGGSCRDLVWRGHICWFSVLARENLSVLRLARAAFSEFRLARVNLLVFCLARVNLSVFCLTRENLLVFRLTSLAKRESVRFSLAKRISSKQGLAKRDSSKRPLAKRKSSRLQTPRLGDSAKRDPHRNLPSSGMLSLLKTGPHELQCVRSYDYLLQGCVPCACKPPRRKIGPKGVNDA